MALGASSVLQRLIGKSGPRPALRHDPTVPATPGLRCLAALDPWRQTGPRPADGGPASYRFGSVTCRLRTRLMDERAIVIQNLQAGLPGLGEGSAALRVICGLADAHGVALVLDAIPFATPSVPAPMPPPDLVAWYGRFGFRPTGNVGMRRAPLPPASAASQAVEPAAPRRFR